MRQARWQKTGGGVGVGVGGEEKKNKKISSEFFQPGEISIPTWSGLGKSTYEQN